MTTRLAVVYFCKYLSVVLAAVFAVLTVYVAPEGDVFGVVLYALLTIWNIYMVHSWDKEIAKEKAKTPPPPPPRGWNDPPQFPDREMLP